MGSRLLSGHASKPKKRAANALYRNYFDLAPDGKSRICKLCKKSYSITTATGNLGRHLNNRHSGYDRNTNKDAIQENAELIVTEKQAPIQSKLVIDLNNVNMSLVRWLIGAALPPSVLEDEMLIDSFKYLNPSVKIWPKDKIEAVTRDVFRSIKEEVRLSIQNVSSRFSITINLWTSYEDILYMSVKCHWIDEKWVLRKALLDICRVPYPCSRKEIYNSLMKVLIEFNIDIKIISCTCTSNDNPEGVLACLELKKEFDDQTIPFCYIPCAAQTLKSIIDGGTATASVVPFLSKIREFVLELNSNPEMMEHFKQLTVFYQENSVKLPLENLSGSISDYTLLDFVKKAPNSVYNTIKKMEEDNGTTSNWQLTAAEKSDAHILQAFLEPIYKTTINLCTCAVPTVGLLLFFMDHVFDLIKVCLNGSSHEDWLKKIAEEMSKIAEMFSVTVDNVHLYLSAVLDPRIKREFIPEHLNSERNFEEARTLFVRSCFDDHLPAVGNGFNAQEGADDRDAVSFAEEIVRKRRRASTGSVADELSQYLAEPPAPISSDALEWWRQNGARYPRLSVMARDFLAMQPNAVEPDELFTGKGDRIRRAQLILPSSSMQAVLCISSWIQSGYQFNADMSSAIVVRPASTASSFDAC